MVPFKTIKSAEDLYFVSSYSRYLENIAAQVIAQTAVKDLHPHDLPPLYKEEGKVFNFVVVFFSWF